MKKTLPHILQALVLGAGIGLSISPIYPAAAEESWQVRLLLDPSPGQLRMEKRGRVMIYDGLTHEQIDRALDTQFDRIRTMMFVRTIVTDDEGNAVRDEETGDIRVEDDGC